MRKTVLGGAILLLVLMVSGCGLGVGNGKSVGNSPADQQVAQAEALVQEGQWAEAAKLYKDVLDQYPDHRDIEKTRQASYDLNMRILFSNAVTLETVQHEVVPGDTLGKISKRYNVTMDLIRASNNLKGDVIRVGQKLRIWTGKFTVLVDKSRNTLMLKNNGEVCKVYSVSTGIGNSTPVGTFKIVTRLENPVWFRTGAVIPPESPENVLGTRWMGFDIEGYGIHGT
ncbi:MAG: LysM peptidoglycan-binding domain-containing protein, partial [Elusimicrobia bacterium]|nr:LysM peptidoglycan-binding domain-containing protein [Elusimicrobiota bacterium]